MINGDKRNGRKKSECVRVLNEKKKTLLRYD